MPDSNHGPLVAALLAAERALEAYKPFTGKPEDKAAHYASFTVAGRALEAVERTWRDLVQERPWPPQVTFGQVWKLHKPLYAWMDDALAHLATRGRILPPPLPNYPPVPRSLIFDVQGIEDRVADRLVLGP